MTHMLARLILRLYGLVKPLCKIKTSMIHDASHTNTHPRMFAASLSVSASARSSDESMPHPGHSVKATPLCMQLLAAPPSNGCHGTREVQCLGEHIFITVVLRRRWVATKSNPNRSPHSSLLCTCTIPCEALLLNWLQRLCC